MKQYTADSEMVKTILCLTRDLFIYCPQVARKAVSRHVASAIRHALLIGHMFLFTSKMHSRTG